MKKRKRKREEKKVEKKEMTLFAKKTGGEICVSTEKDVDDAYVTLQTVSLSEIMNVKIFHFILLIYVLTLIFFFFFI